MTVARAFPYVRYNPDVAGDPGQLLAPPYDVIDAAQREELAQRSPYQSVLLELPADDDAAGAAALLQQWIEDDVLELGEVGVAVVQQRYVGPDGVRRTRIGVLCEAEVSDFSEGRVQPHERTFSKPMLQRLELMREVGANISPVFLLYHDPSCALSDVLAPATDHAPDFTATEGDGTQTAVWFVTDLAVCEAIRAAIDPHPLLIADGHHRYTAAQTHLQQVRESAPHLALAPSGGESGMPITSTSGPAGVLAFIANSAEPGICVFPTHRIVTGADISTVDEFVLGSGAFRCDVHADVEDAMLQLEHLDVPGFVVHHQGRTRTFSLQDPLDIELAAPEAGPAARALDVTALHALILDGGARLAEHSAGTTYSRSLDEALDIVAADATAIAFLMRPAPVDAIHEVAAAGELLPQKSTYFYPKVPTGVTFRLLSME